MTLSLRARMLLALLAIGCTVCLTFLSEPDQVVFDEVHFGGFVTGYGWSGQYFFDIHPPHAKLLIAAFGKLGGYAGDLSFANIGQSFETRPVVWLRAWPALAGALIPAVFFVLLLQLGASSYAAFLGGLFMALDNALIVQSRLIALDTTLLLATLGALCAALAVISARTDLTRYLWAIAGGVFAGFAVGTKFTGIVALLLAGMVLGVDGLRRVAGREGFGNAMRKAFGPALVILVVACAVYLAGWVIHFKLLPLPGPGDAFYKPTGDMLHDIAQTHRVMFAVNAGLTATHPFASPWWSWPCMKVPIYYWTNGERQIYFIGNPALWWGGSLCLLVVLLNLIREFIRGNLKYLWSDGTGRRSPLWIPLAGYGVSYIPLIAVSRVLFMYHYLTPLVFGTAVACIWLDRVGYTREGGHELQHKSYASVVLLCIASFLLVSPLTYGLYTSGVYRRLFQLFL